MQGIFQKENTDKVLKYGIYRHLPTYEKIIRNLVSFYIDKTDFIRQWWESEKYRIRQGTYRVIFVSFADVKQNNYKDAVQKIKNIIVDVYRQNRYLNEQECFTENEHR